MTQSLANKYRSQTFDDLIGQDHISHILKYQSLHHTRQANYLFFGPRGTGKTSSARLFAKALNCLSIEQTGGNPCNECTNCKAINDKSTMDIMEIDAASHTGVDNIREEIIDKLAYRPSLLKKRITIIDEVHMLSKGAFNALLKTMEEPTDWMIFILATTELNKVPETIISRCQVFNFKKIPHNQILDRLNYISKQEDITTETTGLSMIADLSDGCMRDAVKYLDQISVMGDVTEKHVSQFLGVVSDASIAEFISHVNEYYKSGDNNHFQLLINYIENLAIQGVDLTIFPKQLMHYVDRHFSEDPLLASQISILASEILKQSKRYPHPLLLYKTILWQDNNKKNENLILNHNISIQNNAQQVFHSKAPSTDNNSNSSDNSNSNIRGDQQSSQGLSTEKEINGNNIISIETGEISPRNKTITLLSPSLQKLLSGQSELVTITDNIAKLIITNSLAKMTLNKKENQDIICSALKSISGENITNLDLSFMTKEEYFNYQMKN